MLTTSDIEQIDAILVKRLAPIEKDIAELKKDVSYLRKKANKTEKDIHIIVKLFDNDIMDSKKLIERLEEHTRIPATS